MNLQAVRILVILCIVKVYCIVLIALYCIALHCIVLHCIVLYCIVLHCIVLHCIVLYLLHCIYCIALYCIVLHCIVLYCIVLYCIVLHCIVLYCIVLYFLYCIYCIVFIALYLLHCIVLHCIALYCIVLHCIVLYCIVLYCIALYCIVLYCIVLHCIVLYCIVLHCIALYCIVLYCIIQCYNLFFRIKKDTKRKQQNPFLLVYPGRNQGAPAHYQGQDQRSFEAYKSSLDEQYKRDLCRRSRSSRGSSHSSSSSKSSSHVSVQSVISNKENGSQQKQGSTEDKNQRDKKRRHSERSHTKRKVSKEDSRRCRNNATALQSGFTMSKQRGASHETLQDQVNDPSNVGFNSGLARTASSSLTSLLSSSTDISTMSHYEVAVLIANAVDADPEEISKMLVAAAKAKTKSKSRTLLSKLGEAEQQQVEKESVFRNTSSNGKTLAEVRRIRNEPTRSQNMNTQPLSDEREPVASGREVGGSPSSCKTSPFKPSSTSSPQFPFSSEGNPQSLSNTVFSSPTEIHNRNTQPNLSSYNLTNSSLEASVFSSNNPEDVHSARKTQYSKPTVITSAATEAVELVPKFGKTYTVRELPEAVPAVCERKQRLQNIPHDAELNLFDLQGNMSVVSEASPVNVSVNRSLAKHEFGLENDNLHTTREENNKQFLPRDQTDAAYYNRPGTNPGSVQNDKVYTAQVGERMSQGEVQVKGLPPQVDISYGTAVSRAYNMQHVNPSPNTQMPNQGFPYRGTQQLYVNTNPSPLGMPVAQQPPYPVNNYPDHVMIPSGHQLPTPIGPVAMPQFPPHLYGPGNIPLGATVPQMPNYALVGGLPFQHPSVQTVSAGIGPRTSSLVTAFSHAVNTVGTPPFIQVNATITDRMHNNNDNDNSNNNNNNDSNQ